ncbi:hypothetical protein [Amycolatopsis thermophila]|uniref:MFS family arabinose efflux permease n=1 Tax=Amycolatopsis thermophila TaxID=206084 RepID=A0ABU0ELM8_9PSEU|nr:hypothetical protein [Amycolatopsis thermophila]MDQ0376181.1 putative MFS family arabinose efflux permease [Amycolatopsis thermophila]
MIGNLVVGRLADRRTIPVLVAGLALNLVFLVAFALLADLPAPAVAAMLGIGLTGVTMNPAMVTRVQRADNGLVGLLPELVRRRGHAPVMQPCA